MKVPKEMIYKIHKAIFGKRSSSLINATNEEDFHGRRLQFEAKYGKFIDKKYMADYMERILRNVLNPAWVSDRIGLLWHNNDAECFNR